MKRLVVFCVCWIISQFVHRVVLHKHGISKYITYHGTSLETETNKKTETNTNQTHASVSNKGTSNKGSKSNHSSENQTKNTFGVKNTNSGYNIYKLNKPMLGNMLSESNVFGNTMFMEHDAMNNV
jgi:hypothetical protein